MDNKQPSNIFCSVVVIRVCSFVQFLKQIITLEKSLMFIFSLYIHHISLVHGNKTTVLILKKTENPYT